MNRLPLSVEDQLALQRLNADFAWYLDHLKTAELVALFTDDAYYRHGARVSEGRAAIEALFSNRAAGGDRVARHVISGLRLDGLDDGRACGSSVVVTWAADGSIPVAGSDPWLVADFDDIYRKDAAGCWRIERREITRIFVARDNTGPVGG